MNIEFGYQTNQRRGVPSTKKKNSSNFSKLRIVKDFRELQESKFFCDFATARLELQESPNTYNFFHVHIRGTMHAYSYSPHKGPYAGGDFKFSCEIPPFYPHGAPIVRCLSMIYHPNVCQESGLVSMEILGNGWRPVLTINSVLLGLQLILLEPNPQCPANKKCCSVFRSNPKLFENLVRHSMYGTGSEWLNGHLISSTPFNSPFSVVSKRNNESLKSIDMNPFKRMRVAVEKKKKKRKLDNLGVDVSKHLHIRLQQNLKVSK